MAVEYLKYDKKETLKMKGGMHSIKFSHLGSRLRKNCVGNTVSIIRVNLNAFNRGQEVIGYCRGCGFIGKVRRAN